MKQIFALFWVLGLITLFICFGIKFPEFFIALACIVGFFGFMLVSFWAIDEVETFLKDRFRKNK